MHTIFQIIPHVIVICDIGNDYDDLVALIMLVMLHKKELIKLVAVVANYKPALKRAQLARGLLDALDEPNIEVGTGTDATDNEVIAQPWEFDCSFMSSRTDMSDGSELLKRTFKSSRKIKARVDVLCISSYRDIANISTIPEVAADMIACIDTVHMQGGCDVSNGGIIPSINAANNAMDYNSAVKFYKFLTKNSIPTTIYTREAAFALNIRSSILEDVAKNNNNAIAKYLYNIHASQNVKFYTDACNLDPSKRIKPDLDQAWFLKNRTSWYDISRDEALPVGTEILPYLTKVVMYDVVAALGCIQSISSLFMNPIRLTGSMSIVGRSAIETGVNADVITSIIESCLKDALLHMS